MLWAVSTSAAAPIVDGRIRPVAGALPQARPRAETYDPDNHLEGSSSERYSQVA